MESSKPSSQELCQACLKLLVKGGDHFPLNDFCPASSEFSGKKYSQLLAYIVDGTETQSFNYKRFICSCCATKLHAAAEFKQQCINSVNALLSLKSHTKKSAENSLHPSNKTSSSTVNAAVYEIEDDSDIPECEDEIIELDAKEIVLTNSEQQIETDSSVYDPNEAYIFVAPPKKTKCSKCDLSFDTKAQRYKHWKKEHPPVEKKHLCDECGMVFKNLASLTSHIRIHTGEKPFKCDFCDETFRVMDNKKYHMQTHHPQDEKFKCTICDKRFGNSGNMWTHYRMHTGELPHECSICQKKFLTKTSMRDHMLVHTKQNTVTCPICYKGFLSKARLRCHQVTHTKSRNYPCPICDKSYSLSSSLRTHLKSHPDAVHPPRGAILKTVPVQSQLDEEDSP